MRLAGRPAERKRANIWKNVAFVQAKGGVVKVAQFSFFFRPNKSILIPHIPFSASVPPPGGTASDGSSPASSRIPLERSRGK